MIEQDIESVLEITGFTIEELAEDLCVSRITVSNWINNKNNISEKHMCEFYEYVFKKGIRLNKIKCVFRLNGTACTLQREGCPLQTGSF